MKSTVLPVTMILALLSVPALAGLTKPSGPIQLDCDNGGNLAKALEWAETQPDPVILISGTCTGNFTYRGHNVILRGLSPEQSAIAGVPGARAAALHVLGGQVNLQNLTLRGTGIGVHVEGANGWASISDCVLRDNELGFWAVGVGADFYMQNSIVEGNVLGVLVDEGASGSIVATEIVGNQEYGVIAFQRSTLGLVDSTVRANGPVGISCDIVSSINVVNTQVEDHTDTELLVRDRSRVNVFQGSNLITSDEPGFGASAYVTQQSYLTISQAELRGDLYVTNDSFLNSGGIDVEGSVLVQSFSNARLSGTTVSDLLVCTHGDATCSGSTSAQAVDCESATPVCESVAADSAEIGTPPAFPEERFWRGMAPAAPRSGAADSGVAPGPAGLEQRGSARGRRSAERP